MVAMSISAAGLIRIEPLDGHGHQLALDIAALSALGPLFHLPDLEDQASGSDRLLGSLKGNAVQLGDRSVSLPVVSPKGKEKQLPQEAISTVRPSVWEDVANLPAPRIFQPLNTWDHMPIAGPSDSPFLSEGIPRLFRALNIIDDGPRTLPKLGEASRRVARDSDELLPLLLRSTLGLTTTDDLRWNGKTAQFELAPGVRTSDLSKSAMQSSADRFLQIGSAVRRLEILLDRNNTTPLSPTHHAFLHAISTYLTYIKFELSTLIEREPRRSAGGLDDITGLTSLLCDLVGWPLTHHHPSALPSRASYLLTHVHSHLLAHVSNSSRTDPQTLALAFILQESSAPILSLLDRYLGVSSDGIDDSDSKDQPWADLGITRKPRSHSRWEYEFTPRHMPGFIPEVSRQALFEAGKNLRLLREASPSHPLCHGSSKSLTRWTWGGSQETSSSPPGSTHLHIPSRRKERKPLPDQFLRSVTSAAPDAFQAEDICTKLEDTPGAHFGNGTLWGPTPMGKLESFLAHHADHPLVPFDTPTLPLFISSVILAPLLQRARLLSRALVTVYLHDLHFLDHLDVLRAFFLAGDAGFTERANIALFGRDNDRIGEALGLGRRARTRARMGLTPARKGYTRRDAEDGEWGVGLGLGLSERHQWPPGGAELAYALRTTLFDDTRRAEGPVWTGIEDRVSFAVRDLPEEKDGERAKWMDPQAIEALDFLYLSYSPNRIVRHLFPPSLMIKYQWTHNLLLRLARVENVLASMYVDQTHRTLQIGSRKTGVDLGSRPPSTTPGEMSDRRSLFADHPRVEHLVHCLRFRMNTFITALSRYVLDIAIDKNWQAMRNTLEQMKKGNAAGVADDLTDGTVPTVQSIHSLEAYHQIIMDRILRSALLYHGSPSQLKVYQILMDLFKLILDLGKLLKQVEMGLVDEETGTEQVLTTAASWHKTEEAFVRALDRLSQRTRSSTKQDGDVGLLTQHEHGSYSEDLAELHIRLQLGAPSIKRGKWAQESNEI